MNKKAFSLLLIAVSILTFSSCSWFNADQIKSDITNAKDNATQKIQETKKTIDGAVENVSKTIDDVKETADSIKDAVETVKEAKDAIDTAMGNVKNIGGKEEVIVDEQ
ncbi:MAG: hypothetical protein Q8P68_06090 [Candidatus Peregrinibacteria bacterium]|nr:hypothetical protein [Candidatus Peregrinibacteria bacterium]MDZ4244772.1 hypothetical protein [Candidatus Gracilibacteria bacterium]